MKNNLKMILQFFTIWALIFIVSFVDYTFIIEPIIKAYNSQGVKGVAMCVAIEMFFFSAIILMLYKFEDFWNWLTTK
jgi:Kef-type K+ transport system membrane component KefB